MWLNISEAIGLASAIGTLLAAFLIYFQIRSFEEWNRRQIAHQILNDFVSGNIEDTLDEIETKFGWDLLHDRRNYQEIVAGFAAATAAADERGLDQLLRRLLRRFEALCISVDHKIVSEGTCRDYIFSLLTTIYAASKQFIDKERARRNEPKVFEFLEYYAKKWNAPRRV